MTQKWIDRGLMVFAWGLLTSILVAALHDVSLAWDVWYYHLPFAARIAGIVPADQFAYDALNQARFDGFPLLAETLQGALWRVTGRPESANLVAFAAVPLFAWFVRRRFDVPMHLTIIALLAVPLVHIHATSCYVDLPANAAVSALVLLAIKTWAEDGAPDIRTLVAAGVAAAIAANTKALLHPLVLVSLVAIGARALPPLVRARGFYVIGLILLALPLIFATPLKNLIEHKNPYFPVAFDVLGLKLPGPDEPYASSPVWLEHVPRPVRFVCSILELGVRAVGDSKRWTVDQWTPLDAPGYRMGGFFGVYVAFHLALLAWRAVRERRDRVVRVACVGFAVVTAIVSMLPQSHELRYYMCWMMILVVINLWLAKRSSAPNPIWQLRGLGLACVVALSAVLFMTRGEYVYPSGESFAELVHAEVNDGALVKVHDGDRVCVRHAPWNLLWAARFHAPRSYTVTEAVEPADCAGAPSL